MPVALIATRYIRGEERFLYAVAAIMMGLATILTLSRGGTISLLAEMIFIAAVSLSLDREHSSRRRQHRPPSSLIGVTAVGLILTAIVSGILWIGAEPVVSRFASNQTFYEARGSIWQDTWLLIRANPLLGTGLGAYETALPKFGLDAGRNGLIAQAHNDYLQVLADSGIVGGLLLIWFLFALGQGIAGALSLRDPLLAGVGLGCGAGAVGMLVHSFFDFNLQLPSHGLLFLCLSTIATRVKAIAAEPVVVTSKPRRAASELVNEVM
jgi:O-antigen ligase